MNLVVNVFAGDVRHDTGHANETIHTAEADTDAPQTCRSDDALAELFVACFKREHGSVAIGNTFVNLPSRVVGQTGIVSHKAKAGKQLCNDHGTGLLTVHTDRQGLDASQEQEGIEGRESISN